MNKRERLLPTFFVALNWAEKEITHSNTFVSLSLSLVWNTYYVPLLLEKRDIKERECVVRVNDDEEEKVS